MSTTNSLKHHFLVAMPGLTDPAFAGSIIYLCEHSSEDGGMGLIVNKPLAITWANVFQKLVKGDFQDSTEPVLIGGPVEVERGFVLHTNSATRWESSMRITKDLLMTTSTDVISALGQGEGPDKALICLGYAGWEPGQLEQEITSNAWLSVPADMDILFNTPIEDRAVAAAKSIGVDLNLLSADSGHA
ncbi:MAG: putative transcriptional regulator [Flavobacteriales bacterium]|jgi:putative transcriptional regulator